MVTQMARDAPPLVFDIGAHTLKVGTAGDILPRLITPSTLGIPSNVNFSSSGGNTGPSSDCNFESLENSIFPLNPLEKYDHINVVPAVEYGKSNGKFTYSVNPQVLEKLIDESCGPRGIDEPIGNRSVLISEPNIMNHDIRNFYAEVFFETFSAPSLLLCKKAALACFACARTSSIVIDVGHTHTSTCAVQEGYVLQRVAQEIPFGCRDLAQLTLSIMQNHGITVTPGFAVVENGTTTGDGQPEKVVLAHPHVSQSHFDWSQLHIASVAYQTLGEVESKTSSQSKDSAKHVLPDGTVLNDKCIDELENLLPNAFFSTDMKSKYKVKENSANKREGNPETHDFVAIGTEIDRCLAACDGNTRKDVTSSITATGGGTLIKGFMSKLREEIASREFAGSSNKTSLRLYSSPSHVERHFATWIGGSILACLGTFQQLTVTREEYTEYGASSALDRKCP